jgi:threonine/homoserine/homoserine lactone efflux protein
MAAIVTGCALLGALIFGGYAVVFSSRQMVRLYQRTRRPIEAALALVFGYAGLRLLLSRA